MKLSTENLLARLEARWQAILDAPFISVRGPLATYRRLVLAHPEFADAVRVMESMKVEMAQHVDAAILKRTNWEHPRLPSDDAEAALGWAMLERFGTTGDYLGGTVGQYALKLGATESVTVGRKQFGKLRVRRATDEGVRVALELFVGPTHRFLIEHIETDALLLHHFERFATWTRWFGHDEVRKLIDDEADSARKRKQWEGVLKQLAASWVFRDGMPITSITRESNAATGDVDFIAHLGARRAVIEGKLLGTFGPTRYAASDLAEGVRQLRTYVNDHGGDGFLLVFHNHEGEVTMELGPTLRRVPGTENSFELLVDGTRAIGVILVRLLAPPPPSAARPTLSITYADLTT